MTRLLIGTRNKKKLKELEAILTGLPVELLTIDDLPDLPEVEEGGATFEENATLKAVELSKASGLPVVADDSGLEVDALGGAPGVYSARYADPNATDEANNGKLLDALKDIPDEKRSARFRCVIAFAVDGECLFTVSGEVSGRIARKPAGENGFGYDPLFYLPAFGCTTAQLPPRVKNRISHRGQALARFRERFERYLKNIASLSTGQNHSAQRTAAIGR